MFHIFHFQQHTFYLVSAIFFTAGTRSAAFCICFLPECTNFLCSQVPCRCYRFCRSSEVRLESFRWHQRRQLLTPKTSATVPIFQIPITTAYIIYSDNNEFWLLLLYNNGASLSVGRLASVSFWKSLNSKIGVPLCNARNKLRRTVVLTVWSWWAMVAGIVASCWAPRRGH
jgi:hypothetical protein